MSDEPEDLTSKIESARSRIEAGEASSQLLRDVIELGVQALDEGVAKRIEKLLVKASRQYQTRLAPLYHVVPWSDRIIDDEAFGAVYARTFELVGDFSTLDAERVSGVLSTYPPSLMVFRLIAGYTWNEFSDILRSKLGLNTAVSVLQTIERTSDPNALSVSADGYRKLAEAIVGIVDGSLMPLPADLDGETFRSRQHKIDTVAGWGSVQNCATGGVSFQHLLYERYTGRPFAYVRDALSEKKGDILEDALESRLRASQIPYERITDNQIPGFEQAPDFALPDRHDPKIVVESKLAEDGGTARDKASRIERLRHTCDDRGIVLMALVDGKGFRRFNDVLLPTIRNTRGHTYTLATLDDLVRTSEVQALRSR